MAFPTVEELLTQDLPEAQTHTIDLPTTVNSGEILLLFYEAGKSSTATVDTISGWTNHQGRTDNNTVRSVYSRVADGSEGGTSVSLTSFGEFVDRSGFAHVYRVSGANAIEAAASLFISFSDSPDPPSLSPSWGSDDTMWFTNVMADDATISSAPTNYSTNLTTSQPSTGDIQNMGTSWRTNAAASEDPGVFTLSASDNFTVITLAIQGVSGGDQTISLSDSITITDSLNSASNEFTLNDSIGYSDTANFDIQLLLADSISYADSLNSIENQFTLSDSISITDSITVTKSTFIQLNDSIGFTDSLKTLEAVIQVSDSIGFNDSLASIGAEMTITDSISISDSLQQLNVEVTLSDGVSFTDSITVNKQSVGDATKVTIEAKKLYNIALQAKKLYTINLSSDELVD